MIGTFFKLVGKAFRFSVNRPLQRFNIYNRAKKHLGEDAKYFMPAPRAIGALSKEGPSIYPHLERGGFKSIKRKRIEALENRHKKLLEESSQTDTDQISLAKQKSFSETKTDDNLVIEASNKLPVVKTVINLKNQTNQISAQGETEKNKSHRPMPKSTNLPLQDMSVIWSVDKVPPGRLSLNQLQELMINKLADDEYWTPERISESYNIKKEYAQSLITYLRQIRIIVSPRMAKLLDYTARDDPVYQATKDVVYFVDKNLRSDIDRQYDSMYLPTDELDDEVRPIVDVQQEAAVEIPPTVIRMIEPQNTVKRPEPLRLSPLNKPQQLPSQKRLAGAADTKRLHPPSSQDEDPAKTGT